MGLYVPPCCRLRAAGETTAWREGGWIIFDDTQTHEAWNDHEKDTRVVLLLDFAVPEG